MTTKTSTERAQALRETRAEAGLAEVRGIWAHPDDHAAMKKYAAKISQSRARIEARIGR
jgi:thiamine monophosphate synthase